jgi:hypothetical protein
MSFNGDSPTLDDVRSVLERDGRRPILLYVDKGLKRPLYTGWEKTSYEQTQSPSYQRFLERHSNTGVLLGVTDDLCAIDCDTESFFADFIQLNAGLASTLISVGEVVVSFGSISTVLARIRSRHLKFGRNHPWLSELRNRRIKTDWFKSVNSGPRVVNL